MWGLLRLSPIMSSYFADNGNFQELEHTCVIYMAWLHCGIDIYVKYVIECLCECMSFHDNI